MRKDFSYLCHFSMEEWHKMQLNYMTSVLKGSVHSLFIFCLLQSESPWAYSEQHPTDASHAERLYHPAPTICRGPIPTHTRLHWRGAITPTPSAHLRGRDTTGTYERDDSTRTTRRDAICSSISVNDLCSIVYIEWVCEHNVVTRNWRLRRRCSKKGME